MSNTDLNGKDAEPVSFHLPSPWLWHPLQSLTDAGDVLNGCAASLEMLSDLFIEKADSCNPFDSDKSRYGMWLQLDGLARTLETVSAGIAAIAASREKHPPEVTSASEDVAELAFSLNEIELDSLDRIASARACSREEAAIRLIVECIRGKFSRKEGFHDPQ